MVLEKPLGQDRASADAINEHVGSVFAEQQIYRIDHYLGKEAVQNLMALRFGNTLFEPLWRRGRIDHVQITVAETSAWRGAATSTTRPARCATWCRTICCSCCASSRWSRRPRNDAGCDARREAQGAARAAPDHRQRVLAKTVRGQYRAGAVDGKPVPGYLEEPGVAADSDTETFVALKAEIDNWRWAGVPFYLRTGKRLQERVTEIVVNFDDVPHSIFEQPPSAPANRLVIRLQPDESITLTILAKKPGDVMRLQPVDLALDLARRFKTPQLDAYERLLMDVVKGNLTLFMRRDELDAAWRWIDPIREGWAQHDANPKAYTAGSWGPAASSALIGRDGFGWNGEL